MDNRNFWRALFWALLVFLIWSLFARRIWPPPTPSATPTPADVTAPAASAAPDVSAEDEAQAADTSGLTVRSAADDQVVAIGGTDGAAESPFRMKLWLSPIGASIETVRLSDHPQRAAEPERYLLLAPVKHDEAFWRSFALERVVLDGNRRIDLRDAVWQAQSASDDESERVVFSTEILDGDAPVLALERTYTLPKQPVPLHRSDVQLSLTLRNLTDTDHQIELVELGPFGVASEGRFFDDQMAFAAVREEGLVDLQAKTFLDIGKKHSVELYPREEGDTSPLLWYGASNVYFTATLCPVGEDGKALPGMIRSVQGLDLDNDKTTTHDVSLRVATNTVQLPAGGSRTLLTALYLGPKDRAAFDDARNGDYLARDYMQQIKHGYGACSFNFLTDLMIWLLNSIERVFGNFGVAIICLVIIVRTLLHPVTKKTQVNMARTQQRMSKLHPKMEELKKRFGNDAMRLNQETMKLYREEGVSPLSQGASCVPMFIQMPIWIALYASLRNNVAMRCHGFFWWIKDLTAPDALYTFATPLTVPLVGWKIDTLNLLPVFVSVLMFAQQKLMPKPSHKVASDSSQAAQAEQMQKMMPYMTLIMVIFFYKLPSGLNLYIMTSSLIGAIEQIFIRRHITKQDLAGPAPVKAKSASGRKRGPSLFERLQKKAEEAQKLPSHRNQGKPRK